MSSSKCMLITLTLLFTGTVLCWDLPEVPSGKRSEYYLQENNGAYKYGFDSGEGFFAKQTADENNEVVGHFSYPSPDGTLVEVKYTAGAQGFVPEGFSLTQDYSKSISHLNPSAYLQPNNVQIEGPEIPSSYNYDYSSDQNAYHHSSHGSSNAQGKYIYNNPIIDSGFAGSGRNFDSSHGVESSQTYQTSNSNNIPTPISWAQFILGSSTPKQDEFGFNQHTVQKAVPEAHWNNFVTQPTISKVSPLNIKTYHASHNSGFSTDSPLRHQFSSSPINIQGGFAYRNSQHNIRHQLDGGFRATTVAPLNFNSSPVPKTVQGLHSPTSTVHPFFSSFPSSTTNSDLRVQALHPENEDLSYSFKYDIDGSSRHESADADGIVHGKYSYTDEAGVHDLSYIAGDKTGFVVTGGSLATTSHPVNVKSLNQDGSYTLSYSTDNNVHNQLSESFNHGNFYSNEARQHNPSFIDNANIGLVVNQGSLGEPHINHNNDITWNHKANNVYLPPVDNKANNIYLPPVDNKANNEYIAPVVHITPPASSFLPPHTTQQTQFRKPSVISYTVNHDVEVNKYLPPVNSEKVGYIFKSKN